MIQKVTINVEVAGITDQEQALVLMCKQNLSICNVVFNICYILGD